MMVWHLLRQTVRIKLLKIKDETRYIYMQRYIIGKQDIIVHIAFSIIGELMWSLSKGGEEKLSYSYLQCTEGLCLDIRVWTRL